MLTDQTSARDQQQSTVDGVPEFAAGVFVASPLDLSEDVTEFGSVVVVQNGLSCKVTQLRHEYAPLTSQTRCWRTQA